MNELKLFLLELAKIGNRLTSEQVKKPPDALKVKDTTIN